MPPRAVRTIRNLIYWQCAKLIAESAGVSKNYRFIMSRFKKLQNNEIQWSGSIREQLRERELEDVLHELSEECKVNKKTRIARAGNKHILLSYS